MSCTIVNSVSAIGCSKSSVLAAVARILSGSRRSASTYPVTPSGVLVSRARAWTSTIGSLST